MSIYPRFLVRSRGYRLCGECVVAEIYPPHWAGDPTSSPTGTPVLERCSTWGNPKTALSAVLTFFCSGGTPRIKTSLRSRSVCLRRGGDFYPLPITHYPLPITSYPPPISKKIYLLTERSSNFRKMRYELNFCNLVISDEKPI
jgi:hypothetical protein